MPRGEAPSRRGLALLASAYLILAGLRLLPFSLHLASRLPDDGDAPQGVWILWSVATGLGRGLRGFFEANAYYPHPSGLLYSEPLLVQGVVAWPLFYVLPDNHVLVNNLILLATFASSGLFAHLLLREHVGSDGAAAAGAVVFAFGAYNIYQLPRLQLASLQWMPLGLLALGRLIQRGERRDVLAFATFSLLQAFSCLYYLAFYLTALAVILPVEVLSSGRWRRPRLYVQLGLVALACGAVVALVVRPYLSLFRRYGFSGEPGSFDLAGFLQPPPGSPLHPLLGGLGEAGAGEHFLGIAALLLGTVGLAASVRGTRRGGPRSWIAYLAVGALAFILAAGPEVSVAGCFLGRNPLFPLFSLPPFDKLRDPDRFSILVTLALAFFVAKGAAALRERLRSPALMPLVLALLLGEQWAQGAAEGVELPVGETLPTAYQRLAALPEGVPVAELPVRPFREIRLASVDAYLATYHGKPILLGKPSFYPPAMELIQWELRGFPDDRSLTLLRALGVRFALVHPHRWRAFERRFVRALERREAELPLLERFPDPELPLWNRYGLGGEQLREIPPLTHEGSPLACDCREIPRETLRVVANGTTRAGRAIDGRQDTAWTSGEGQREGHFFEIRFDRPRRPTRVEIEMAFPYGAFARNLRFNGFRGHEMFPIHEREDVWYTVSLVRQLVRDPSQARLRYELEPTSVDRMRLFISRTEEATVGWSIPELHVYE